MAGSNVAIIRRFYDALGRHDLDSAVALLDPAIEWRWPRGMLEGATVFRGREAVRDGIRAFGEAWQDLVMEPTEFLERGDEVFVLVHYRARGRASGVSLDAMVGHVWSFRNGLVRTGRMFGRGEHARDRWTRPESD